MKYSIKPLELKDKICNTTHEHGELIAYSVEDSLTKVSLGKKLYTTNCSHKFLVLHWF